MSNSNQVSNGKKAILSATWATKASTKYEIYLLLCTECKAYLPRIEHITVYFLKEIISGKKKALKQNDVQHLFVPQYEGKLLFFMIISLLGLGLKEIFEQIDNNGALQIYFPDQIKERARLPKAWICNVLSSTTNGEFAIWVKKQIDSRNLKRAVEADKLIEVDPEIYDAFQGATSISRK